MPKKILVVDDEKPVSDVTKFNLAKEGSDVSTAYDGEEAVKKVSEYNPDLMTLDLVLPEKDGLEVAREVHQAHDMPTIMVTVKDTGIDEVLGLEMGADDHATKPFSNQELVAKVKADLRRRDLTRKATEDDEDKNTTTSNLVIMPETYMVEKNGEKIELTRRRFELLYYPAQHMGQMTAREHSLQTVWGYDCSEDVRAADVTVRRLCEKIEDNLSSPTILVTRRGVGYHVKNPSSEWGSKSLVITVFFAIRTNEENKKRIKFYQF